MSIFFFIFKNESRIRFNYLIKFFFFCKNESQIKRINDSFVKKKYSNKSLIRLTVGILIPDFWHRFFFGCSPQTNQGFVCQQTPNESRIRLFKLILGVNIAPPVGNFYRRNRAYNISKDRSLRLTK